METPSVRVLVVGDSGVGKTRCYEPFAACIRPLRLITTSRRPCGLPGVTSTCCSRRWAPRVEKFSWNSWMLGVIASTSSVEALSTTMYTESCLCMT
ncbi:hypothetical protein GQ600_5110 [Phytophthora cactorum]|nr:hypothetical protein GQ600_5110 [Phytophthora cactorum]